MNHSQQCGMEGNMASLIFYNLLGVLGEERRKLISIIESSIHLLHTFTLRYFCRNYHRRRRRPNHSLHYLPLQTPPNCPVISLGLTEITVIIVAWNNVADRHLWDNFWQGYFGGGIFK